MRIAFISFDFPEYCIRHANVMAEEHDVLLMLPENHLHGCDSLLEGKVNFQPFHKPRFRQPIQQLRLLQHMWKTIRRFRPDVVHFQHGHMYFNWLLPLLRRYPLVVTIHDPRQHLGDKDSNKVPQWLMDRGYRSGHRNIVHSLELIDTIHQQLRISKDRLHFVPHIAIGQKKSDVAVTSTDELKVLFFGRIWAYKGLDYFIQSEPFVTSHFPNVRFVIAGRGEDFDRYRNMMKHPDRFEVHNDWISDEMRSQLFSEASIVVLPYVEATQSGVVPIAYSHEKPVIATRVGGLPEVVEHGKTGILVEPRDVQGLSSAIIELLKSPQDRERMGKAGAAKLHLESNPELVVQKTLDVYRQAISDNGQVNVKTSSR